MASLTFAPLMGSWRCGSTDKNHPEEDAKHVGIRVTRVGCGATTLIFYVSPLVIDFDGAPTAYGPPGTAPLDELKHGGDARKGYYGVVAYSQAEVDDLNRKLGFNAAAGPQEKLRVDTGAPALKGRYPLFQRGDQPAPGYYVSSSSRVADHARPEWDQRRFTDATAVLFGALGGQLARAGFALGDKCVSLRPERAREVVYPFGDAAGEASSQLSEVSLATALALGAKNKDDDDILCGHFAIARSASMDARAVFRDLAAADNADDLPVLVAAQIKLGPSGDGLGELQRFKAAAAQPKAGARPPERPPQYGNVLAALKRIGFEPAR